MGWTWRGHPIRPGDLGTGNLRLPAEPHRGGTGLEALLPAEPPGPSPSHPRGRGPPPEKQQGLRWGEDRRCGMWRPWARTGLEGPENRARRKPRAGGPPPPPPHPLRTEAWSCCPFDVRVFLCAPLVTGRSWAGTRAGGHAHAHSQSYSSRSATGSQASTFTFRWPRGLCASEPPPGQHSWRSLGPRQRQGGSTWAGAPREKLGSWAVALACGGPGTGHRKPLGEVWPCARAQMRGRGHLCLPTHCPLSRAASPLWLEGQGPLQSSLGPPILLVPDTSTQKRPWREGRRLLCGPP